MLARHTRRLLSTTSSRALLRHARPHRFPVARGWASAALATATAKTDAENMSTLFDHPSASSSRTSELHPTGLFLRPHLTSPHDFDALAERTLARAQKVVERILRAREEPGELRKVVKNLDRLSDLLCGVIDMAELVRHAHPDGQWVEAANRAYEHMCFYMNVLNTEVGLYDVLSQVLKDPSIGPTLTYEERQVALIFLRDFEKSCIHLSDAHRRQFVSLSDEILVLGRQFLLESSEPHESLSIHISELAGMPTGVLQAFRKKASMMGKLKVEMGSWEAAMIARYAPKEEMRKRLWMAANIKDDARVQTLERLLEARSELAELVGKESYGEMILAEKMAKRPENVMQFLQALNQHHRPLALEEINKLSLCKQTHIDELDPPPIHAWDRDFYAARYSVDTSRFDPPPSPRWSIISPTVGSTFRALSSLFTRIFGMHLRASPVRPGEIWHPDVYKLEVVDEQDGVVGWLYVDLWAREGKQGGAAHYTVQCSRRVDDDDIQADFGLDEAHREVKWEDEIEGSHGNRDGKSYQLPVAVLLCDFARPTNRSGPTILSPHEIETLFHEMGHAMHSMIGRTDYHNVSGTRCATDFVELPSVLMEHFASSPSVLALMSPAQNIPCSTPAALQAIHQPFLALDTHTQILMATLDQVYHSPIVKSPGFSSTSEFAKLQDSIGVVPSVRGTAWQTQFSHLYGYGATYYSYLFDRAIASKVWRTLFKANPLDREMGERYKREVLQFGGGKDPWEMVGRVIGDEAVMAGDMKAMEIVGKWGIDE